MGPHTISIILFITVSLLSFVGQSQATLKDPLTMIELETSVHFLEPDGSDVLLEPGTYSVEPVEAWIRVESVERQDAILIQAQKGTHELELEQAIVISEPGASDDERDNHYVMLLLPDGESLEATGTYSGVRPRGLWSKSFSRIKTTVQTASSQSVQWDKLSQVASVAAATEARNWLRQAYIDSKLCRVWGPAATGRPGVLKSRYSFQGEISKALNKAGASQSVAQGWDQAFKESWTRWAKDISIPALPFYPAFSAWPGPQAPPMPNVPHPLGLLSSKGSIGMDSGVMGNKVREKLGSVAKNNYKARIAATKFADDIGSRFDVCMAACSVHEVIGSGPVPAFAPPHVPMNVVMNGTCKGGKITVRGF